MNSDSKLKKLVVSDIICQSMSLYKDNFSLFFRINAIGVLILFVTNNFVMLKEFVNAPDFSILINLVGLVIGYIGIYYNIKITISLIFAIKDRYSNEPVHIKEVYTRAKHYTWSYIGTMLLLGLMLIIPIIFITIGIALVESIFLKIVTISIGVALSFYIMTKYGLALYIRIFKPKINDYFSYSKKLVESHFWKVLIISSIPFIIMIPNDILQFLIDESNLGIIQRFIYTNSDLLISLFTGPLVSGIMVITYLKLDTKEIHTTNENLQ